MPGEPPEKISRTKKKKAALALQRLGEQLVTLSPDQLAGLGLDEELLDAVLMAKDMKKHEALRRQMQYIGSLMRRCDGEAITEALEDLARQDDAEVRRFKRIEQWRDELASGDDERLRWVLANFPDADTAKLTRLVQAAREIKGQKDNRRAGRKLFRYLWDISEASD
jgi:ribosome-associated protein